MSAWPAYWTLFLCRQRSVFATVRHLIGSAAVLLEYSSMVSRAEAILGRPFRRATTVPSGSMLTRRRRGSWRRPQGVAPRSRRGVTRAKAGAVAGPQPARPRSRPAVDQAALTSIVLAVAARGAGTLTSSIPFAYLAST